MSKQFNEQLMKFELTNDSIKMEISLQDLAWLFTRSPENFDGSDTIASVKSDKLKEFGEYMIEELQDGSVWGEPIPRWGVPFEEIFGNLTEGYENEFLDYKDEEDEEWF